MNLSMCHFPSFSPSFALRGGNMGDEAIKPYVSAKALQRCLAHGWFYPLVSLFRDMRGRTQPLFSWLKSSSGGCVMFQSEKQKQST